MPERNDRTTELSRLLRALCGKMRLRRKEIDLIRLYADLPEDDAPWEAFFRSVDVAREDYAFCCMLARLMQRTGGEHFPKEMLPLLSGLRKKLGVKNLLAFRDVSGLLSKLSDAGIPVMMIKGGSLRFALLPDVPQRMSDIDLVVPEERYREAVRLAEEAGLTADPSMHSADMRREGHGCADIHYRVFKENIRRPEPTDVIAKRGGTADRGGISFAVPSPEDAFLLTMVNAFGNFMTASTKGPVSWIADCVDLADRYDPDGELIAAHAKEYGVFTQFCLAAQLLRCFLPDRFPALYAAAGAPVPARAARRIRAYLRLPKKTREELADGPVARRFIYRARSFMVSYRCMYHLSDPPAVLLRDLPGMILSWRGIGSMTELPREIARTVRRWREQSAAERS